jgi:hypothetical protein
MKMADYISRDDVLKAIDYQHEVNHVFESEAAYVHMWETINDDIGIKSADVQPVKWISVKDRLPDENQKCLVYRDINADLKITTGIWHSERKVFDGLRHGTRLEDTIAWMPLPELPKDGEKE